MEPIDISAAVALPATSSPNNRNVSDNSAIALFAEITPLEADAGLNRYRLPPPRSAPEKDLVDVERLTPEIDHFANITNLLS
jgi:hypothetical protein